MAQQVAIPPRRAQKTMKTNKLADEIHKPVSQIVISRLLSHYARWLRGETQVDPKPAQNQNIPGTTISLPTALTRAGPPGHSP
jgi:hypothetical protein